MKKNEYPLYELTINEEEDSIVSAIALVSEPAIESNFLKFNKQQITEKFSFDDEKMELIGAAMIPDMQIVRVDEEGNPYYVYFSKDTVKKIAQSFFKNGFQKNLNLDHTSTEANSFVYQSFIVDSSKGINPPKGLDLPEGTWVIGAKVMDENVWKDIKEGKRKGFSVEGVFEILSSKVIQKHNKEEQELLKLVNELTEALKKIN